MKAQLLKIETTSQDYRDDGKFKTIFTLDQSGEHPILTIEQINHGITSGEMSAPLDYFLSDLAKSSAGAEHIKITRDGYTTNLKRIKDCNLEMYPI